ncbi:MAG: poly-beta-1,6-N-acetyl-D-glucosamine N-deacetylase PgaB, partial [Nitrospirota bacterium]
HGAGLAVFVWMPVRAMDWAVQRHPDWQDWSFDPASGALRPSGRLDSWRPDVQRYLVRLLTDLAGSGIDGLLFGEDLFVGEYGGLGPAARARFAAEFQRTPRPELFWSRAADSSLPSKAPTRLPMFWRWAGWKSRAAGEQMAELVRALRTAHPGLLVAQNVAPEAISRPAEALARWNLDLLALAPAVDYVAVLTYPEPGQSLSAAAGELTELVDRAVQLVGAADRIMIKVPLMDRRTGRLLPDSQIGRFLAAAQRDHAPGVAYLYNSEKIRRVPHRSLARPSRLD